MAMYEMPVDRAVELLARGVEQELVNQVREQIKKYIDPIVEDAARGIARRIRTALHTHLDVRTQSTVVTVMFDGIQQAKLEA